MSTDVAPTHCTRCMKNWPFITYILDILKEISTEKFRYYQPSCLLYKHQLLQSGRPPGQHTNPDFEPSPGLPQESGAMTPVLGGLHADMKSCAALEELDAPSWYQGHNAWPASRSSFMPHIISEPPGAAGQASATPSPYPGDCRIYINWVPGMIVVDQAFSRTLKFDPSNHEEFKASLTDALQRAKAPAPTQLKYI